MLQEKPFPRSKAPFVIITLFIIVTLLIGALGGVAGFVFLTNNDSPVAKKFRNAMGLDLGSSISIPVKQNLRLEESSAVIDASRKVKDAVVSITANRQVTDFFGQLSDQEIGAGTGFILTSDGLIATNKHVVSQSAEYKVVLNDGRILPAKVQAVDQFNDFAVLKVDAKDLPTVDIGSSEALEIGQFVLAVGNALGEFNNSVTLGVVSAKERSINADGGSTESERLTGLIQTDAAVNPGNSGGPLVNMKGQVVGINTAIASTSGGSIGLGFAIPIDSLKSVIDSVRKTGEIVRPYLGVRYVPVTKALQKLNNLSVDYGALVSRGQHEGELAVLPGSPADKAGVLENDIILEVNGDRVDSEHLLTERLQRYNVGDQVTLTLQRKGEKQQVKVTLEQLKSQ